MCVHGGDISICVKRQRVRAILSLVAWVQAFSRASRRIRLLCVTTDAMNFDIWEVSVLWYRSSSLCFFLILS